MQTCLELGYQKNWECYMKINEVALGQKHELDKTQFEEIWDNLIVPNCSEILNMYKVSDELFYRGIRSYIPIFRGSSRINRKPLDSFQSLSDLYDISLKECGITALRSNSTFIINNYSQSFNYGTPFIIFPIDGFEYTFTNFNDLTLTRLNFREEWANLYVFHTIQQAWENANPNKFLYEDWTCDLIRKQVTLDTVIQKINIILNTTIKPEDLVDLEKFKRYFNPRNTNLINVLINKFPREILIKGSYYAFNENQFSNSIRSKLQS